MIQAIFFAILIITLLSGTFAYFAPSQKPISPMKFMMDNTGYNSMETLNRKKTEQINMVMNRGVLQIRRQMEDLALEQSKFLDMIRDQQQILKSATKDASDILMEAQQKGEAVDNDLLQLRSLTSQMQDQGRLLVAHGEELIALNNQLTASRQQVAEQIDLANINTEASLNALQERSASLNNKAAEVFQKVNDHNQQIRDQIQSMHDKLQDLSDSGAIGLQQPLVKDSIHRMLSNESDVINKLADNEQKSKQLVQDAQDRQAEAREQLEEKMQQSKDMIEDERQKAQDQQEANQQHIADQMQRIRDQQNR